MTCFISNGRLKNSENIKIYVSDKEKTEERM